MFHRALERLDAAASTLVPLLYLAGLALGTIAYFTDVRLGFALTVGIALALAAEVHSFLAQRRVRGLWATYTRMRESEDRDRINAQLWVQGSILAGLVVFSAYNATAFVASTWTPAPGWLPAWLQIGVRGLVVPALFLVSGFLSPLSVDAGDVLATASREMLHHTIVATVKQWKRRIKRARAHNLNLAPVAVALMLDAGDPDGARRVSMIDTGLAHAESGGAVGDAFNLRTIDALASVERSPVAAPEPEPEPPAPRPRPSKRSAASVEREPVLMLSSARPRRADAGRRSAEAQARWQAHTDAATGLLAADPLMSTRELARRMGVSAQRATEVRRMVQPVKPARSA